MNSTQNEDDGRSGVLPHTPELLTPDELSKKIIDIFLINGAVTIEETESENFLLSIDDVVAMFDEQIKGVRDANG